jgi:hypothetical protein
MAVFRYIDVAFNALFLAEFVLKSFAVGLRPYLSNRWNVLDVVLLLGSVACT